MSLASAGGVNRAEVRKEAPTERGPNSLAAGGPFGAFICDIPRLHVASLRIAYSKRLGFGNAFTS